MKEIIELFVCIWCGEEFGKRRECRKHITKEHKE